MKILSTSAAAAALVLASASASPVLAQDWAGGYIGVYGGASMADDDGSETLLFDRNLDGDYGDTVTTPSGADAFAPGFCGGRANSNAAPGGCSDDNKGVQGGVRAGYDWQFGQFVVGGVADVSAFDLKDAATGFSVTPAAYQFTRKLEHVAAARARVGYAYGPALIYATGGYAVGKVDNRFYTTNGANSFTASTDDDKADGWQAGGGVEYKLAPNLSITGEYLYTSLDAGDYVIRVGPGSAGPANPFILAPNTTGTDMIRSSSSFDVHAVQIGMNYRF
ncbi:outer membrane protein [Brevundimonas sp.]|uniref:outer membrane protein n=1 Tax=Brevundimonas sp. TaxID=1871086 RepID=UPI003BAAAEF3